MAEQTLASLVAGQMAKAAAGAKQQAGGTISGMIEAVTGDIEDYNKAVEAGAHAQVKLKKASLELEDAQQKVNEAEAEHALLLKEQPKLAAKAEGALKRLREEQERATKAKQEANDEYVTANSNLQNLTKTGGKVSNGLTILAAKVAGVATAFFSWRQMVESFDKRIILASKHVGDMGDTTGDMWDVAGRIKDRTLEWNTAINKTNLEMAKLGVNSDETGKLMAKFADELRLTTDKQGDLVGITSQATQDVGRLSKLLRVSTDELAEATVVASKKFGKGTASMSSDLAGVYDALKSVKEENKGAVINLGDLTRGVLESQASFQGFNLNLRETARVMGGVAAKAQEQGATYEQSMKAAKGLTDIISGGGAPDWAKYVAGDKMLDQLKSVTQKAKKEGGNIRESIAQSFKIDTSTAAEMVAKAKSLGSEMSMAQAEEQVKANAAQVANLERLSQNYKEYGALSSANMAEELLRGTAEGNKQMFDLLKKYGSGNEGRELLKRVWGLDDAAATAATLALDTAGTYDQLVGLKKDAKAGMAAKMPPTMADVTKQTDALVAALGVTEKGISGFLENIFGVLKDSPMIMGAVGTAGAVMSGGLQVMQMKQTAGLVQSLLAKGGGAAADVAGTAAKGGGLLSGLGGLATGVGGGMSALAGGATAGGTFAAAGGGLAGVASVAGPLLAAGAAGAAVGTGLRYLSSAIEEATGGFIPSVDTITQGVMDFEANVLNTLSFGLLDFRAEISASEDAQNQWRKAVESNADWATNMKKVVTGDVKADTLEFQKAAFMLKDRTAEELKGYAVEMAKAGGIKEGDAMKKLLTIQAGFDQKKMDAARGTPSAAAAASQAGVSATVATAQGPAVATLSAAQKKEVTTKIATKLEPEVTSMSQTMFEKMGTQSDEFYEAFKKTTTGFWQEAMPRIAAESWTAVALSFDKKMKAMDTAMMPLGAAGGTGGAAGGGGMGGVQMAPDGSIIIKFILPRNVLDKSNRQTAALSE